MKRIISVVAALALVAFIAAPAMAFELDEGEFAVGIVGGTTEMVIDMQAAITNYTVTELFSINDIGSIFNGATQLSDLRIGGAAYNSVQAGRETDNQMWVAVAPGESPIFDYTGAAAFRANLYNIEQTFTDTVAGDFVTRPANTNTMSGLLDGGVYNGLLDNAIGSLTLASLTASNPIIMDIWMYDNLATNNTIDDEFSDTKYRLTFGINANDMVYAQVSQVPVPGAIILLGSGLLALVGVRRQNA